MLFPTILVSFLLIGSSFAQRDSEKMQSVSNMCWHAKRYVDALVSIYAMGPNHDTPTLKQSPEYENFESQGGKIRSAMLEMNYNEMNPSNPDPLTKTAEAVIADWKNATEAIILKCINGINVTGRGTILEDTSKLMKDINKDDAILEMHKKGKCPILGVLKSVIRKYETEEYLQNFLRTYAPDAP